MNVFNLDSSWFWKNVVAHLLGGVFPGTWFTVMDMGGLQVKELGNHLVLLKALYSALATPQLWIGAGAGIAMIAAAVRLRRWRDDN
jgi:ABC-2 type transport system permease protein